MTRELAEAWVQALGFAQLSTLVLWEKAAPGSPSLAPLSEDPVVLEIVSMIPTIAEWQDWQAQPIDPKPVVPGGRRSKIPSRSPKTRWTKQGKPVAGPNRS